MQFSELKNLITEQFKITNEVAFLILGSPGGGKSYMGRDIFSSLGFRRDHNWIEFNGSTRDPVDVHGTPIRDDNVTRWAPPEEFYKLRAGVGPCALLLEELTDATVPMQNALCRLILDRYAGNLKLSDQLYIIANGNFTTDKSGANRLTTKLANRLRVMFMESNLNDWIVNFAEPNGVDPILVKYLQFRPEAFHDFQADRPHGINPTPRSWTRTTLTPTHLPDNQYFASIAGDVGEGRAAEYTAFRRIWMELTDFNDIVANPDRVKVPEKLDALFATVGQLISHVDAKTLPPVATFVNRLPLEQKTMFWIEVCRKKPTLRTSKEFVAYATTAKSVMF